jgi:hypothetical protein
MKAHLMKLIRQSLSPSQVITHHKAYVKEQALQNEPITWDTFVLPFDIKNLAKNGRINYGKNVKRTHLV